jgi:serpin B
VLVDGNSAFAFDLYQALKKESGNLFYSPYSISVALAMTYAGARDETAQQMADTLHFVLPGERLHASFSALGEELSQRNKDRELMVMQPDGNLGTANVTGFRLNIVNALWGQKGYPFLQDYLDLVEKYYGGGLKTLDFASEPEPSRQEINEWASEQTEGRINNLLSSGDITPFTRLVLANAVYFKARWQQEFSEKLTRDDNFYLLDGGTVSVPMMHQQTFFRYSEGGDYQAVRLPYLGEEMAMVVLLPREGKFMAFEDSLDAQRLKDIVSGMESREVRLTLPKFKFETKYDLVPMLSGMGMTDAFAPGQADFSGMADTRELFIGTALQKAFVSVDEVGTEAAAVTAIGMAGAAAPTDVVDFTANRPFVFLIQDIETGTVLFVGRVVNPNG